jgi:serine/threonine-protein kinase
MCNILGLGLFLEMTALRTTDAVHARLAVPARWSPASRTGEVSSNSQFKAIAEHIRLGPAQPVLVTPSITIMPQFSPDGRWLAYTSSEPGREGLWVKPASGAQGEWQVGNVGGRFGFPVWSRNGHDLKTAGGSWWSITSLGRIRSLPVRRTSGPTSYCSIWVRRLFIPAMWLRTENASRRCFSDGATDEKAITHVAFLLNFFDERRRRFPAGGK